MSQPALRPLAAADAPWAAKQHARLMENTVLARFGAGFLETIYRAFACSPHAVSLVWAPEGKPLAVIACTSDRRAFLRELLLRSGIRLALLAGWAFLTRGDCRRLLLRVPHYLRRTHRGVTNAELIFIIVDPACRGIGVARTLIEGVLEEYRRRGVRRATVSIESDNRVIRKVLEDLGFRVVDTFSFADKSNDLLARELAAEQSRQPQAGTTAKGGTAEQSRQPQVEIGPKGGSAA